MDVYLSALTIWCYELFGGIAPINHAFSDQQIKIPPFAYKGREDNDIYTVVNECSYFFSTCDLEKGIPISKHKKWNSTSLFMTPIMEEKL